MHYNLNFQTYYNQFYISDKNSPRKTNSVSFWTDEAFQDRLAIEDGILGIGTECYGPINGEVNIHEMPLLDENFDQYDHVVEGGISFKSGIIQILTCPDSNVIAELTVVTGIYLVRVYSKNLSTVDGDEGDDYYIINIWPGISTERKVLKRYHG